MNNTHRLLVHVLTLQTSYRAIARPRAFSQSIRLPVNVARDRKYSWVVPRKRHRWEEAVSRTYIRGLGQENFCGVDCRNRMYKKSCSNLFRCWSFVYDDAFHPTRGIARGVSRHRVSQISWGSHSNQQMTRTIQTTACTKRKHSRTVHDFPKNTVILDSDPSLASRDLSLKRPCQADAIQTYNELHKCDGQQVPARTLI